MIDYGDHARLGVIVPSGNPIAEPELRAMLPPGIGMVVTRLPLRGSSEAELLNMLEALEPASRLLADAKPDAIAFHCTAVSTFAPSMAGGIRARIQAAAGGTAALATADAILAALAALGAKRLLLVTPYIAEVHAREIAFFEAHGLTVTGGDHLGIDTNAEMSRLAPADIAAQARLAAASHPGADACLISCTAIRSAGVIAPLEAELGIPVVTSNQALAWYALRAFGRADRVPNFGRLFEVG